MPAANFPEYAQRLEDILNTVVVTGEAALVTLQVDQRSAVRGFIAGSLQFHEGSVLHFREFINTSQAEPKIMYAYHYQDAHDNLIFRYDNAVHRPGLSQPDHKHTQSGINVSPVPTLLGILDQIFKHTS
jgi:uncharacterized protein DUF6516